MRHPSSALGSWEQLTTGRPAALDESAEAKRVAQLLADLQGCEAALLGTSTLHLFWDFLGMLADEGARFFMDSGLYPIGRWGLERAAARGASVQTFRHYCPSSLRRSLQDAGGPASRPVVVVDGSCMRCGRVAPLTSYLRQMRAVKGLVVVDDTQALGVLGARPTRTMPYGLGGGGSSQWWGVRAKELVLISSLAKGFGAPVAALSSRGDIVEQFATRSETRVHCSPPSQASIRAATNALTANERIGNSRRSQLLSNVRRFRAGTRSAGFTPSPGLFPVQILSFRSSGEARRMTGRLRGMGVQTVLLSVQRPARANIAFLINADHNPIDISSACQALARARQLKLENSAAGESYGSTLSLNQGVRS